MIITTRTDFKLSLRSGGFTLIELLVSMAIFLAVAGTAFTLFNQHASLVTKQQNLSGVNIGLRNAMAQMQIDVAGAGQNLLANVAGASPFNVGVIIQNSVPGVAPACAPTAGSWAYPVPSACYDSLSLVSFTPGTCAATGGPMPVLVLNDPGAGHHYDVSKSSTMFADDPNNPGNAAALTNDATCFKNGDEILVVELPQGVTSQFPCANGTTMTYCLSVVSLTKDGKEVGQPAVQLQHNPTGSGGVPANCPGTACSDPLNFLGTSNFTNALGYNFPNGNTYIIDLGTSANDVTYSVQTNPANPTDPQLVRCIAGTCNAIADQVIGFKVGAALWDNAQANATDIANYFYDASKYCSDAINNADCTSTPPPANDPYDFTLVRSMRFSIIARTPPLLDQTLTNFKNGFDQGPYLVQQASVVVDLRNMTIPDFGN